MRNFALLTIFFLLTYNIKSFAERIDIEELSGFEITDSFKIKPVKASHFLHFSNNIETSEEIKIQNWEEGILNGFIPQASQTKQSKITYSSAIDFGVLSNKYLGNLQVVFTSRYLEKEQKFNGIEKYGGTLKKRLEKITKYLSLYLGVGFYKLNILEVESGDITQKNELSYFFSTHLDMQTIFLKLDLGVKKIENDIDYNSDLYLKFKLRDNLHLSSQFSASIWRELASKVKSFSAYGSYSAKFDLSLQIKKNLEASFGFGYEKNKRYGFKRQNINFNLKYFIF